MSRCNLWAWFVTQWRKNKGNVNDFQWNCIAQGSSRTFIYLFFWSRSQSRMSLSTLYVYSLLTWRGENCNHLFMRKVFPKSMEQQCCSCIVRRCSTVSSSFVFTLQGFRDNPPRSCSQAKYLQDWSPLLLEIINSNGLHLNSIVYTPLLIPNRLSPGCVDENLQFVFLTANCC